MYRPLALDGSHGGVRLVSHGAIAQMGATASAGQDAVGLVPSRFTLGFMKSMDRRGGQPGDNESASLSEAAFGHAGFGGSMGFADPEARMSFGYTTNKQRSFQLLCDRGQALVDAAYASLGYAFSDGGGVWYRV
jgi:CubicO group peptidase (beta-lactamase class C family)